jgi:hypothetical protein
MATSILTTTSWLQTTNNPAQVITALKNDRSLRDDDLQAGTRVSALLIGVFAAGLLMMLFTVLVSLKF